jgi:acyl-CoA hydrolase
VVSIPRNYVDIVVTEYGVARLQGKSVRQRAQELIAIAHPDFRPELRKAAQKLFWP